MPAPAPDLAPAVAEHRDDPRSSYVGAGVAALVVLVVGTVRGDGPLPDPVTCLLALLTGGLLLAVGLRKRTVVGPGWLVERRLTGSSWVRTDQLADVRSWGNVTDVFLELRDRDGRRAQVAWSAAQASRPLADRLKQDVRTSATGGAQLDARAADLLLPAKGRR